MSESNSFDVLVDEYISQFPSDVQVKLQALRQLIRDTAPNAVEKISYKMPTYAEHGNLVHFAAYSRHIGFYPGSSGIEAFKEELSRYKGAKGSVQFPLDQPLPEELVRQIVQFRVQENVKKAQEKKRNK
ncbi:iron chaperone [Paenibacillus sp. FSL K6-0108]|uniref:iron chaperone n=1 Tax=Paenibacillus sp. FSL K6-0108 TaxID=2921417 RepID=UPI00324F363F